MEGLTGPFAARSFKAKESFTWEPLPLNVWQASQNRCEGKARYRVSLYLYRELVYFFFFFFFYFLSSRTSKRAAKGKFPPTPPLNPIKWLEKGCHCVELKGRAMGWWSILVPLLRINTLIQFNEEASFQNILAPPPTSCVTLEKLLHLVSVKNRKWFHLS